MVWSDGERLGTDHTVTFRWGNGEEVNAYAVTTATLPLGTEAWMLESPLSVCMPHISAIMWV